MSFAVMDELPIDQPEQVSAILSDGDRPMLPLLVGDNIVEKKSPEDFLEMVEVQPSPPELDRRNSIRKRSNHGSIR